MLANMLDLFSLAFRLNDAGRIMKVSFFQCYNFNFFRIFLPWRLTLKSLLDFNCMKGAKVCKVTMKNDIEFSYKQVLYKLTANVLKILEKSMGVGVSFCYDLDLRPIMKNEMKWNVTTQCKCTQQMFSFSKLTKEKLEKEKRVK